MGNIGILALGDYSFTPLDARSALIATALIATTYLDCSSFKKGRQGEFLKVTKWTETFDNLTAAELAVMGNGPKRWSPFQGWLGPARLSSSDSGAGASDRKISQHFNTFGKKWHLCQIQCLWVQTLYDTQIGAKWKLSGSKMVQLYLFLLSEESIQLHLVVSLMKDHYSNSFSLVSMWANAFSLTSPIHDTNN